MIFVKLFWMLWSAPAVLLSSVAQVILRAAGWLELYRQERIEFGQPVNVYFAAGWFAKRWPPRLGGCAWLPACVILNPWYKIKVNGTVPWGKPWVPETLGQTHVHELEHANQWRQWSLLFPLAYGVAALLALPHSYHNNYFERRARRVAGQGE
jgi:hypothetical protein